MSLQAVIPSAAGWFACEPPRGAEGPHACRLPASARKGVLLLESPEGICKSLHLEFPRRTEHNCSARRWRCAVPSCKAILWFAILLLASVPLALAQGTYTQIDPPGSTYTVCSGIDTAEDIAGYYADASGNVHGFLLSGAVYTTIDYPGAQTTYLAGINDLGQAVGGTESIGFLYEVQTQTFSETVSYPGASYTGATAINGAGTIVGYYENEQNGHPIDYGFELIGSAYTKIAPPHAGTATQLLGVTTAGEIIGDSTNDGSFLYNNGKYVKVTIPNANSAHLYGINPAGSALVGSYVPSTTGGETGFLYQHKVLRTLEFPGANETYALGVNASGEVVGYFESSLSTHGFTWTPPADAKKR
jgi:hypothetical protein